MTAPIKVLFVCLGNICRSPSAEAVFSHKVAEANAHKLIHIDSAGTAGYHVGESPDQRACEFAKRRGYSMDTLQARQVSSEDFERFDYIIAMDNSNLANLRKLQPHNSKARLNLMLSYAGLNKEVPDPYYGGDQGFETVLDLLEQACDGLLTHILK